MKRFPVTVMIPLVSTIVFAQEPALQLLPIPDHGMRYAIATELDKPFSEITIEDMDRLTELRTRDAGLRSVEGLGLARNMVTLDLSNSRMFELNLPEGLTNLSSLTIGGSLLTNITFPNDLSSLSYLRVDAYRLANVSFLSKLPNLAILHLNSNLRRIRLPSSLANLTELNFGHGGIQLEVPVDLDLSKVALNGAREADITFYIPLTVERVGERIKITWPQGVLQSMNGIDGDWKNLPDAASPYEIEPAGPRQFFRVASE